MASYNRVTILGYLSGSPELKFLPGGETAIVEVAIAVNERFKKDDEYVESVSFIDTTFFGRTAEVVNEYLRKGSPILVEGRLKQDTWEKDGKKRSRLKVICEKMTMVGGKKDDDSPSESRELVGAGAPSDEIPY